MNFNMQPCRHPQGNDLRKKIEDYSYGLSDVIGKGYSSLVFKGLNQRTKEVVAIKVIDIRSFKDKIGKQMLEGEIDALRKLNHVNILKCYDVYSTVNNCYIITEFCTEGDLQNLLKKRERLSEADAIPIFRDVFKGFRYLANRGFLHRDLKPANIFIKDGMYKIADFGFAKRDSGMPKKQDYNVGTPLYMSPEALKGNIYTVKNDIWSVGVIFYEIIHGSTPWQCKNQKQLLDKVARQPISFTKNLSDDLKDFIRRCLTIEEDRRISITEMESHPFIKRILNDAYLDEYQSAPPLLNKISSNIENKEQPVEQNRPKDERRTKQEKSVTSQIFFMRYMFRLSELLPRGKLHFFVLKQMLSTLETLKAVAENKNAYDLDNWDEFLTNDKFKKIQQVINDYSKKYAKLYGEIEEYVKAGSKDKRFLIHLDSNFQRSETLALAAIFYSIQDIRAVGKQLREEPSIRQMDEDTVLSEELQRLALRLDFTTTYYQLNCLSIDNWSDIDYFARTSKIQLMTEYKPSSFQKSSLRELQAKIRQLDITF